jgi:hypothetical protein
MALAKQSGIELYGLGKDRAKFIHYLTTFAELVAAKERARCAFLCDELWRKGGWDHNAGYAADRIRALK